MSQADLERFQRDLRADPDLARRIYDKGVGLANLADFAKENGYDVSAPELKAHLVANQDSSVSDEELPAVAAAGSTWTFGTTTAIIIGPIASVVAGPTLTVTIAIAVVL